MKKRSSKKRSALHKAFVYDKNDHGYAFAIGHHTASGLAGFVAGVLVTASIFAVLLYYLNDFIEIFIHSSFN